MAFEGFVPDERDFKRIGEAVRAVESGLPLRSVLPRKLPDRDFTRVKFRNNSGETCPAYAVMRITSIEADEGVQRFVIAKPDTSFNRAYLVNSGTDVASGAASWGTWLHHADWILYDDANTPAFGEEWGPQASSWEIKKYRYGFTIWGNPSGGSTDLVMASQRFVTSFVGKADGTISADGGSGTFDVYDGNQVDTGSSVTGINRTGVAFTTGTWGKGTYMGGTIFLEPWEC